LYSVSHGLAELTYVSVCPLKEICDTLEVSVLLVEQNARAAIEIADYVYVLERGEVVLQGACKDVIESPIIQSAYLGG